MDDAGTICLLNITTLNPLFVFSHYSWRGSMPTLSMCLIFFVSRHHSPIIWIKRHLRGFPPLKQLLRGPRDVKSWKHSPRMMTILWPCLKLLNHVFFGRGPMDSCQPMNLGKPRRRVTQIHLVYCIGEVPWNLQRKTPRNQPGGTAEPSTSFSRKIPNISASYAPFKVWIAPS